MDYALGGGSSGGVEMDGGARSSSRCTSWGTSGAERMTSIFDVNAVGAHGAIVWHPAGAHGRWQGICSCAGVRGLLGAGAGARLMFICAMPAMPRWLVPPRSGAAHSAPLPSSMDWSITSAAANAVHRCGRLMTEKVVMRRRARKV